MDTLEEKFSAILSDPNMMQNILSMAKSLGQAPPDSPPGPKPEPSPVPPPRNPLPLGKNELEMIGKLTALTQQTGLDRQEQALLQALNPYLAHERLSKLEKAMHAAKMARFAALALEKPGQNGR